MAKLSFYKWYFDKTRELETLVNDGDLTLAQAAELFFAVQHYADAEEKREMSCQVLKILFKSYCSDVDRAIRAYQTLCEVRAESGAKGGKKKAANAAAADEDPRENPQKKKKFKPPTKAEFTTAARRLANNNGYEYDQYETDCLYDELQQNGWLLEGKRHIFSREDWEMLILIRLYDEIFEFGCSDNYLDNFIYFASDGEPVSKINDLDSELEKLNPKFNNYPEWSINEHQRIWRDYLRQKYDHREEDNAD